MRFQKFGIIIYTVDQTKGVTMNYFIISNRRDNIEEIKNNYKPIIYFDLLDRDLSQEEFFVYVVDIMSEVYAGHNVLITTTNHKGTKKLFETVNYSETPNCCTIYMSDVDGVNFLDATKIDRIIVEENCADNARE